MTIGDPRADTDLDVAGQVTVRDLMQMRGMRRYRAFARWRISGIGRRHLVIPPFLMGPSRRIQAAVFSFIAGVMPPMPMLGRSLL